MKVDYYVNSGLPISWLVQAPAPGNGSINHTPFFISFPLNLLQHSGGSSVRYHSELYPAE